MIKFGTSGFRGIMGENFTKENLQKIGVALVELLKKYSQKHAPTVAIGYDNRFMSDMYAKWVAETFVPYAKVVFYNVSVPTPLICWKTQHVDLGIQITASHNEYYYNGIKIFVQGGREIDPQTTKVLEKYANKVKLEKQTFLPFDECVKKGYITLTENYQEYCDSILNLVDVKKIKNANLKVLVNCMHGSGDKCTKYLLKKLNMSTSQIISDTPDPYFEFKRPAPFAENLKAQALKVKTEKFDLGVAFDGDADRFSLISSSGKFYDCNFVSSVIYDYLLNVKNIKADAVKNKALTNLIKLIAHSSGQQCFDAKVGFKEIALVMKNNNAIIGAESNGIAYKNHILSKDGISAFCLILDVLANKNQSFEQILQNLQKKLNFKTEVVEYAYPITPKDKERIRKKLFEKNLTPTFDGFEIESVDREIDFKINYQGGFWGLIRFSGTEPVVRIFSEMPNKKTCEQMVKIYEDFIDVHTRQE